MKVEGVRAVERTWKYEHHITAKKKEGEDNSHESDESDEVEETKRNKLAFKSELAINPDGCGSVP